MKGYRPTGGSWCGPRLDQLRVCFFFSSTRGHTRCSRDWSSDVCCFFFQAEDGIRDVAVTGVQTCALPILVERDVLKERGSSRAENVLSTLSFRTDFSPEESAVRREKQIPHG